MLQCSHRLLDAQANLSSHGASAPMQHHKTRTSNGLQTKQEHLELTLHARLHWHRNSRLVAAIVLVTGCSSCGIGVTVFGHRGSGALGPFATDQHLTIHALLRAIIQSESGDTVASSMINDTTEKSDREDCACAVQQARFSASVQSTSHCSLRIQSSLHNRRESRLWRPFSSNTS